MGRGWGQGGESCPALFFGDFGMKKPTNKPIPGVVKPNKAPKGAKLSKGEKG